MDIPISDWFNNLGTAVRAVFNTTAMTNLSPAEVIFDAAVAYRIAQESYNNGTTVSPGVYLNFASPITEDATPVVDNVGEISKQQSITLFAKTVYLPNSKVQPQQSVTLI